MQKGFFGPSRDEIWSQLSNEIGADFIKGGFWKTSKVISDYKNWSITLDTYTQSTGKSAITYTRIRAPFIVKDEFKFKLYNIGIFSAIGKMFGMQNVVLGYSDFDEKYILKSNNEEKAQELFFNSRVQELVHRIDKIHLELKDDEGFFSEYPQTIDLLYFQTTGVIKDIEKLKDLFLLFYLILELLVMMGVAYDANPEFMVK